MAQNLTDRNQAKMTLKLEAKEVEAKSKKIFLIDIICLPIVVFFVLAFGTKYPAIIGVGVFGIIITISELKKKKSEMNEAKRDQDDVYLNVLSLEEMERRIDKYRIILKK